MRLRFTGVLLAAFLLFSGLPATASTHSTPATVNSAASTVTVVMKNRSFRASVRTVPAGRVTFVVRNAGTMKHEFVVVRTNRPPRVLPMKGQQASEVGAKGEIEEFAPGRTMRLTLTLEPGAYVLLCNLPGHYVGGQSAGLVVTPAASAETTTNVTVSMFEMGFKLSQTTVPHGTVIFEVRNDGRLPHDFSFGSRGGGTPLLQPGQSATLTVTFAKPGEYTYICTVEGHSESGMIGALTVT